MNYKPIIIDKFKEFMEANPEFTLGELFYSIFRKKVLKGKPEDKNITWLLDIEDKDFYTAIDRAIIIEQE